VNSAEEAVNERLAQRPEQYLLALAQFAIAAEQDVMRSFSLVLLRRLLFRIRPTPGLPLYDLLSASALGTLQRLLLSALSHEQVPDVRRKAVDTITDLANHEMARGRPWHALQAQAFSMADRESAFRIFSGCPNLVMDLQIDVVVGVFEKGLQDSESAAVRHAAFVASVEYLSVADRQQLVHAGSLLSCMLESIHALSQSNLYQQVTQCLTALMPLCSSHPSLFAPYIHSILGLFPPLILLHLDPGPTPTLTRPYPSSFDFPPATHQPQIDADVDAMSSMRHAAVEFMISLSEARPAMVRNNVAWVTIIVNACLDGMSEFDDDQDINVWLKDDVSNFFVSLLVTLSTYTSLHCHLGLPMTRPLPSTNNLSTASHVPWVAVPSFRLHSKKFPLCSSVMTGEPVKRDSRP